MSSNNSSSDSQDDTNFPYTPNEPAALFFCVLFGLTLIAHVVQAIRGRAVWMWPMIIGLIMECEGYAFRYVADVQFTTEWPLVVSQVSVIVAPAFMAAQYYMIVGRIMSFVGGEHSIISHHLITKIFVISDVISILSQAVGASMVSSTDFNTINIGFKLLIGALCFQAGTFALFLVIAIVFDVRSRRALGSKRDGVQPLLTAFYVSAAIIIVRSLYRVLEFATVKFTIDDASGYTLTHEWLLWVFDSTPIFIAAVVMNVFHPSKYLPRTKGPRLDGTWEDQPRGCCCCCRSRRPKYALQRLQSGSPVPLQPVGNQTYPLPKWQQSGAAPV